MCTTIINNLSTKDLELVEISKNKITNLICQCDGCVFVVSTQDCVDNFLFVKYLRFYDDIGDAHEKFLHLIGKLSIKPLSSKYFANPIYSEHMFNGLTSKTLSEKQRASFMVIKNKALDYYNKWLCSNM